MLLIINSIKPPLYEVERGLGVSTCIQKGWAQSKLRPFFLQPACKPDSVSVQSSARELRTVFHHLSGPDIAVRIIRPTPRHRASSPYKPVYMVFQPIRRTASCITAGTGELLPHLFTLAPLSEAEGGGYFLLHYYTLADIFLLGSMVLFVARTFLSLFAFAKRQRWNGLLRCKISKY